MRAFNVMLSILLSLALGLLVFELGLSQMPAFREQVHLNQFDARLGWTKKPNHSGQRSSSEFSISFKTNAAGLREAQETPKAKPDDTFRVLLLGDSFVLGYTVEESHVFGTLLENAYRAEGRAIEVINAGTEGYSTDQEALWLIEQGLQYEPDLVLLFPFENDIYWNGQSEYNGSPKPRFDENGQLESQELHESGPRRAWHQNWASARCLRYLARQLFGSRLGAQRGFEAPGAKGRILNEFAPLLNDPPQFVGDCLQRTRASLAQLRDACRLAKVQLAMLPIPSESAIHADEREAFRLSSDGLQGLPDSEWSPDRPVELFLGMASELGILSLDARAALRERAAKERLYFQAEWHLNPAGNAALAEFIHSELDRRSLIPGRFAANSSAPLAVRPGAPYSFPTRYLLFGLLWLLLGSCYCSTYREERAWLAFLKVGLLLCFVFGLVLGGGALLQAYPKLANTFFPVLVLGLAGFILYKLGRRIATVMELLQAFILRGHWYLMPVVVILLSIGSLLVVAASSPLIAPFIYTLF